MDDEVSKFEQTILDFADAFNRSAKAGFYLLEVLPETLAAAVLMSLNVQRVFATGRWGDTKSRDPSPEVIASARK